MLPKQQTGQIYRLTLQRLKKCYPDNGLDRYRLILKHSRIFYSDNGLDRYRMTLQRLKKCYPITD